MLSRLFKNSPYFPERCEAFLELLSPLCKETTSVLEMVKALEAWSEADVWVSPETSKQTQGVRLMTVHSAKGLEFDHVWIVDNLRIPPRNAPPAISGANGVLGIRYRDGNDWVETRTYQQLKQLNKQADAEESKRILYVALTRARESLTVFLPDQNKNSSNDCWASYLEEALQ